MTGIRCVYNTGQIFFFCAKARYYFKALLHGRDV